MTVANFVKEIVDDVCGPNKIEIGKCYIHPEDGPIKITYGQYWGTHGLSNHWHWTMLETGETKSGYGGNWKDYDECNHRPSLEGDICDICGESLEKPILYLDIDGVLNVFGWGGPDYNELLHFVSVLGEANTDATFNCVVPPYIAPNVKRLQDYYEIVWCTAWRGSAHLNWRNILDLPNESWEYIDYKAMKLPELLKHAKNRRWAYVDDDGAWEVLQLLNKPPPVEDIDLIWPNGQVFPVDARFGLDDDLTERLIDYAQQR